MEECVCKNYVGSVELLIFPINFSYNFHVTVCRKLSYLNINEEKEDKNLLLDFSGILRTYMSQASFSQIIVLLFPFANYFDIFYFNFTFVFLQKFIRYIITG